MGYLKVSSRHELYFEVCGNENGIPVLFLHGGPGAGFSETDKRFFDFETYRVIFYDQRGAARSKPFGSTIENMTSHLVQDINLLLETLGLNSVYLFGGSWGATLALVYAIQYPEKVRGLILRGIFLGNKSSIDHYLGGGVEKFYPEVWSRFVEQVPLKRRNDVAGYYLERMKSSGELIRKTLAYEWAFYEISIFQKDISTKQVEAVLESLPYESLAILEAHYLGNNCFLAEDYILDHTHRLQGLPVFIVQGRYDMICPPVYAYQLHEKLEKAELFLVDAGHSDKEAPIEEALIRILSTVAKTEGY